ncbi:unnamed protein product [Macrosiphum euphorbiae]|uniref:CCHC-type domain-containing protein n=1 Tax=Macrosiphum euphorbiae TaxID=13131 RepID=A0AAV0XVQ8_9HEMI|nr:unnamed protein product [Macrosiphum euphorbiae]
MSYTHHRTPPPNRGSPTSPKPPSSPNSSISTKQPSTSSKIPQPNENAAHKSKTSTNTMNNNITSSSQQKQQPQPTPTVFNNNPTTTFAEKLGNGLFPKKEQAIVFDAVDEISQIEYIKKIGDIVKPINIISVSKISKKRFCIFLNSKELVTELISKHKTIEIQNKLIHIRHLYNPDKRFILANVYNNIPNSTILEALRYHDIIPTSPITCLRAGIQLEGYSHILSFRRQLFIKAEDLPKMPSSIFINYDGTNHRIFISDDQVTCFNCKMTGHVASKCPHNIESQNYNIENNIEDINEPAVDLITDNWADNTDNTEPITPMENIGNNDLINIDNSAMDIDLTGATTDNGGIKRAASSSTTPNATQEPISIINKIVIKPTVNEKKQTSTTSTATKIQKDQVIKKSKTLVRSNSTEKLIDNIKQFIEPARNIIKNNKDINIDFDQLKNIVINAQGNADPSDICKQYGTDTKTVLNTIEVVRPAIKSQSLKNRLTRLSTKLLETMDLDNRETTVLDTDNPSSPNNYLTN